MSTQQSPGAWEQRETSREQQVPSQYDAAWIEDYRKAISLNILGMLTPTSFASDHERNECQRLIANSNDPAAQRALESLLVRGQEREVRAALTEQREPHFVYPLLDLDAVQQHLHLLYTLEQSIDRRETGEVVRRLYLGDQAKGELGAIPYHTHYLQLVEAVANEDDGAFWQHNLAINPVPTEEEMRYALSRVKWFLEQGSQMESTRGVSRQLTSFLTERLSLDMNLIPDTNELKMGPTMDVSLYGKLSPAPAQPSVSAEAVRAFFTEVLRDQGCTGWEARIDYAALTTRLEPGLRYYILAGSPYPLNKVVELVVHEWLAHISPRVMGERSSLGLLGLGTGQSLTTEEGAGLYYEWDLARRQGRRFDESRIWLGILATGLAAGVLMPPQNFVSLNTFFELFLTLYRMIWRADEELPVAREKASNLARIRCLRTYRGVPYQARAGICYTKDTHYARGFLQIYRAVEQDPTVLDWLASGVITLEQIPDLQSLGISPAVHSPRALLERSDLEKYILSFETAEKQSPSGS
jgi:hypothetical protein